MHLLLHFLTLILILLFHQKVKEFKFLLNVINFKFIPLNHGCIMFTIIFSLLNHLVLNFQIVIIIILHINFLFYPIIFLKDHFHFIVILILI